MLFLLKLPPPGCAGDYVKFISGFSFKLLQNEKPLNACSLRTCPGSKLKLQHSAFAASFVSFATAAFPPASSAAAISATSASAPSSAAVSSSALCGSDVGMLVLIIVRKLHWDCPALRCIHLPSNFKPWGNKLGDEWPESILTTCEGGK